MHTFEAGGIICKTSEVVVVLIRTFLCGLLVIALGTGIVLALTLPPWFLVIVLAFLLIFTGIMLVRR